jgi:hypothetical protein
MIKIKISIRFIAFLLLVSNQINVFGQVKIDTPEYPSYGFFDRSCYIKTAYPIGEIHLPQGGVDGMSEERPMRISIPTNRPTWALAIAHAWNYNRNIIQRVDHPKIALWMAITAEETGMACDCDAVWPQDRTPWETVIKRPPPQPGFYNEYCGTKGGFAQEGCFQMLEGVAWCGDLNQTWPRRFKPGRFSGSISGGAFEISALGFAYRSILNNSLLDYAWGVDIWPIIDATKDPNAYEKLIASGWNNWAGGVQQNVSGTAGNGQGFNLYTAAGRAAAIASDNWDLTATDARYPEIAGWAINALEQNTTSSYYKFTNPFVTSLPGPSQNHVNYGYYNEDISWSIVNEYLTIIYYFYSEFTASQWAVITQNVQKVFNSINGGAVVPFKQLGPVIDEIILNLPKENPVMSTVFNASLPAYNNGERKPMGKLAPASHIINLNTSDSICINQSIILEGIIDGGDGPNLTYSWFKDGVPIGGNTKQLIVSSATLGQFMYTLVVCNAATDVGGCAPACCPKTIVVNNCNTCSVVATATTVNTPCQNMHGGKINLNISGTTDYTVFYQSNTFKGTQKGTTSACSIIDVPDGVYNITVTDNGSPACKFLFSTEVKYTIPVNEKLSASIQSMTPCDAVLQTKLEQNDCECEWSVYFDTPNGAWGDVAFVIITPSIGQGVRLRKDRAHNYPAPTKTTFKLCSGEHIKFEVEAQVASGSCAGNVPYNTNEFAIDAWIVDPNGVEVLRTRVPAHAAVQYTNFVAFDYVVNCPYTPGMYSYSWNPGNLIGTPALVSDNLPTIYTVVATNTALPQCTLTDTVLVPFTCNKTCVPPQNVVITSTDSDGFLCPTETTTLTTTPSQALTGFDFTWFKDDVNSTSINTATALIAPVQGPNSTLSVLSGGAGTYYVRIRDVSFPTSSTCYSEAKIVIHDAVPPTYTITGGGTFCADDIITPVTVNFTAGVQPYQITTNPGAVDQSPISATSYALGSTAGTYNLTAISDKYCTGIIAPAQNKTITINTLPKGSIASNKLSYCGTPSDVILSITPAAGVDLRMEIKLIRTLEGC